MDNDGAADHTTALIVAGLVAPWVVLSAFFMGHNQIDRLEPAVGAARGLYLLALTLGAAAASMGLFVAAESRLNVFAWGIGLAVPGGAWLAAIATDTYGFDGLAPLFYIITFGGPAWMALGITVAILATKKGASTGATVAAAGGIALALAPAIAALYHLITLSQQAENARLAHESPGVGFLLALVLLGLAGLKMRR